MIQSRASLPDLLVCFVVVVLLLAVGGPLAGSLGRIIGVGPGRGTGLLFIVLGVLSALASGAAYLYPRVRHVEEELPDAVASVAAGEEALAGAVVSSPA